MAAPDDTTHFFIHLRPKGRNPELLTVKPSEFLSTKIQVVLLGSEKVSVLRLAPADAVLVLELFQLEFVVVMADPK